MNAITQFSFWLLLLLSPHIDAANTVPSPKPALHAMGENYQQFLDQRHLAEQQTFNQNLTSHEVSGLKAAYLAAKNERRYNRDQLFVVEALKINAVERLTYKYWVQESHDLINEIKIFFENRKIPKSDRLVVLLIPDFHIFTSNKFKQIDEKKFTTDFILAVRYVNNDKQYRDVN